MIPEHFLFGGNELHGILVGQQHVAISQQHGIADLASAHRVIISPGDFPFLDNVSPTILRLASIEEIMLPQALSRQHGGTFGTDWLGLILREAKAGKPAECGEGEINGRYTHGNLFTGSQEGNS